MRARPIGCDATRLRRLLRDDLSDEEREEVDRHLDRCRKCQRALEELAAGRRWWQDLRAFAPPSLPPCRPAPPITRLDGSWSRWSGVEGAGASGPALGEGGPALDFLGPTDDPTKLGRLGRYEVMGVIGAGGMGLVLKGFEPALNRVVAIKVLAPELATSAAARRRFSREAQAAAAVVHDHVVAIHAVDAEARLPYIVMQYVSGRSLQQRIDRDGPLPVEKVLRVGMQVALGLAAAHAQGLVHRDVKPANILLENGVERVKITDFGLARAVDDASQSHSGVVAGTPHYMAPEQARGEPADHRADLFSLGSVLYAMCTGRPPFRAETVMGVLRKVSEEPARPVRQVNPEVPEWLEAIVSRLHAADPADRFQTAAEVGALLEQHLAGLQGPSGAAQAPRATPRWRPTTRRGGRRWAPTRSGVKLAVAVACLAATVALNLNRPPGHVRFPRPAQDPPTFRTPTPVEPGLPPRPPRPTLAGLTPGEPRPIPGLEHIRPGYSPCLTPDLLTIVFARYLGADRNYDLFLTTRGRADEPFGRPVPVASCNTQATEAAPALSPDGLELIFARTNRGRPVAQLLATRRGSRTEPFPPPEPLPVPDLPSAHVRLDLPQFLDGGRSVAFLMVRLQEGGVPGRYYMTSQRVGVGDEAFFEPPTPVPLPSAYAITSLSDDARYAFRVEGGGIDVARRHPGGGPFGRFAPVQTLTRGRIGRVDGPFWIAPAGDLMFYCSEGPGPDRGSPSDGDRRLWMVRIQ